MYLLVAEHNSMVLVLTGCAVGVPMPDCFQAGKPVFRFVVMTDIICLEWTG